MPRNGRMEIKMTKNHFKFGNKFGSPEFESEYPNFWPYYFNMGFCVNEMKWAAVEKVKGVRDYSKGDAIRAQFDEWNLPLHGNTLLWEVRGQATPKWYDDELKGWIKSKKVDL